MTEITYHHHDIVIFDKVLTPAWCAELVTEFETNRDQYKGEAVGNTTPNGNASYNIYMKEHDNWQRLLKPLKIRTQYIYHEMQELYPGVERWAHFDEGWNIRKCLRNKGPYSKHFDAAYIPNEGLRQYGMLWYLNTIEDGGGTHFEYQDITVDAVLGRVAVFPAWWTHVHQAMIPKSDNKYVMISFLCTKLHSLKLPHG